MHPIFVRRQRLGLYLLAWAPLAALLAVLMVVVGHSRWGEGIAMAVPLALVFAFLSLAAWYPCRAMPLESTAPSRAIAVHGATTVVTAAVWVALAWALGTVLDRTGLFAGAGERVVDQAAVLLGFGILAYLLSVALHYLLAAFESSREADRRALEAEVAARVAELQMLRAQIDPHFLFNSLNSISSLTTADPEAAREMCIELGDFLRGTLRLSQAPTIPLEEELALLRRYLAIEKVRFGPRLQVEEEIGEGCGRCLVPSMLFQPLVENALKHGIAGLLEGGTLTVRVSCDSRSLRLEVGNPVDPDSAGASGEGVGLVNLRRRLSNLHGDEAWLETRSGDGDYRARVTLPAVRRRGEAP